MVYVFFADGFEEIEGLTVVDLLRRKNIPNMMVSISEQLTVTGAHGIKIYTDAVFFDLDFKDATMYVLPGGGTGTQKLKSHAGLDMLLREAPEKGIKLAAICAAPSVLGQKGLLKGKRAICFPGFEEQLTEAIIENQACVQDGDIITSRGMGTSIDFALKIVENFIGKEESDSLSAVIQYK